MSKQSGDHNLIYGIDDVPPLGLGLALGFQHYLTMLGSTVAIPLFLAGALGLATDSEEMGYLFGTLFFVSGICTLLQSTFGNRLPIIQGGTFSFLAPTIAICGMTYLKDAGFQVRMQHVQGAIIAGAFFEIIVGYLGLVGRMLRFISPVVIAPTIALIGLALFKFGAPVAANDWTISGLTIGLIILFSQVLRNKHKIFQLFPVLLGIGIPWILCAILSATGVYQPGDASYTSFTRVQEAQFIRIPYPFQWGWPVFGAAAIVGMIAGYLASMVESVGDYYACARMSGAPVPSKKTINKGIGMEGIGCLIAGVFGTGNGTTSYSENIGAIGLTRVGSRRVVQYGAGIMMVLGLIGPFGALFTTIPGPVVGGMYCSLFGVIAAVGLSNLQFVDLNSSRNLFVIGFSLFMGLSVPEWVATYQKANPSPFIEEFDWASDIAYAIGSAGMAVGAIIATILDNIIPGTPEERGLTHWQNAG